MLFPNWIVFYLAIAGVGALIFGARRLGLSLLLPAGFRWGIYPLLWPVIQQIPFALIILTAPVFIVFGGLLLINRTVSFVYGPRAGGHVTGTYLVRVFDSIGRGLLWIISLPIRGAAWLWQNRDLLERR